MGLISNSTVKSLRTLQVSLSWPCCATRKNLPSSGLSACTLQYFTKRSCWLLECSDAARNSKHLPSLNACLHSRSLSQSHCFERKRRTFAIRARCLLRYSGVLKLSLVEYYCKGAVGSCLISSFTIECYIYCSET